MPRVLEPGVLYFSEEFGTAAHLCACGCGEKIRTPIGPAEWRIVETRRGPSLSPSVGNWQKGCKSHYWITDGQTVWSEAWSEEQIARGRQTEQARREAYYEGRTPVPKPNVLTRIWQWLVGIFKTR